MQKEIVVFSKVNNFVGIKCALTVYLYILPFTASQFRYELGVRQATGVLLFSDCKWQFNGKESNALSLKENEAPFSPCFGWLHLRRSKELYR